jgi:hypothetical protein
VSDGRVLPGGWSRSAQPCGKRSCWPSSPSLGVKGDRFEPSSAHSEAPANGLVHEAGERRLDRRVVTERPSHVRPNKGGRENSPNATHPSDHRPYDHRADVGEGRSSMPRQALCRGAWPVGPPTWISPGELFQGSPSRRPAVHPIRPEAARGRGVTPPRCASETSKEGLAAPADSTKWTYLT